jgi:hypothetical protein
MYNTIKILGLLLILFSVQAQEQGSGTVLTYSGPNGNYIRVLGNGEEFQSVLEKTAYFEVERRSIFVGENKSKKSIGKIEKVKTMKELIATVGEMDGKFFLKNFNINTDQELVNFFMTNPDLVNYQLFHSTNIDFLVATGYAFLDTDVSPGETFSYYITRIDKSGNKDYWGAGTVVSGGGNPEIKNVELKLDRIVGLDSAVVFDWEAVFPEITYLEPSDPNFENVPLDSVRSRRDVADFVIDQYAPFFNKFQIQQEETKFKVYYKINDGKWTQLDKVIAGKDSVSGKPDIIYTIPALPEDLVYTKIIPEDYARNLGRESDEMLGVAISNGQTMLMYGIEARDSVNSIIIEWPALPNKAYYTGIEISRSAVEEEIQLLDVLPITATQYIDYDVFPAGTTFTYHVRPLFLPKQNLLQEIAATASSTCVKFSKPLPPFNLSVEDLDSRPSLKWESMEEPAKFAHYVYRGLSPTNLQLINQTIYGNTYIDSTVDFSPRSTYYFAVLTMNLAQDTSAFSNIVSYNPKVGKLDLIAPVNVSNTLINNMAFMQWSDEKAGDDFVYGYILQRADVNEKANYKTIHRDILGKNYYLDSNIVFDKLYYYRVATISVRGDSSAFSIPVEVGYLSDLPQGIEKIELQNLQKGISVSWPPVFNEKIAAYQVMRKQLGQEEFKQLAEVKSDIFEFLDENIKSDTIYEYAVLVKEKDQRVSQIRGRKSIRRKIYSE